ncbi:aldehyde dehydrogenase family protein [Nocardia sp. NPDC055029]
MNAPLYHVLSAGSAIGGSSPFPIDDEAAVDEIVALARDATAWWTPISRRDRGRCLLRWADHLAASIDDFAATMHREQARSGAQCRLEIEATVDHIRWAARHAGRVLRSRRITKRLLARGHTATVEYLPYGVVGVIGPGTDSVVAPAGVIADALAVGNTVVFKPSEHASAAGKFLVDAFNAANPAQYLNVVSLTTGDGSTGEALCRSEVDKIAFIGSGPVARRVLTVCAANLIPALVSCGGEDVMIVAADADPAAAAAAAVAGAFGTGGRRRHRVGQVYVEHSVKDEFLARVRTEVVSAGVPREFELPAHQGKPDAADIVYRHVHNALLLGATALVGGRESVRTPPVGPVVLIDPPSESLVVLEDTPGPVLVVRTMAGIDEAVHLVNRQKSGLGVSVFSRHGGPAIAERLITATVVVNSTFSATAIPAVPFGRHRMGGYGRFNGAEGLLEFAMPKSVCIFR